MPVFPRKDLWTSFVVLVVLLVPGCGKSDPLRRQALTGEVKLAGQPLDEGTIQFEPLNDKGVASGGLIKDGKFAIAREAGLPVGQYRLMIFAPEKGAAIQDAMPGDTMNAPLAKERVPAEYNTQSRETINVSASQKNHFVLDIPAK